MSGTRGGSVGVRHVRLCAKPRRLGTTKLHASLLLHSKILLTRAMQSSQLRQIIALRKLFSRKHGVEQMAEVYCFKRTREASTNNPEEWRTEQDE